MAKIQPVTQPWDVDDDNVELKNCILTRSAAPQIFSVDALADQGDWIRGVFFQLEEDRRDELLARFRQPSIVWHKHRTPLVIKYRSEAIHFPKSSFVAVCGETEHSVAADWIFSPQQLLCRFEADATSIEDRVTAVLFAETVGFDESEKPRLLRALFNFVKDNRFSQDDEMMTAVGAAIRKFAMNMSPSHFADYASLFGRTNTDTLSCELELELAKAVVWKLATCGGAPSDPALEAALTELAQDYSVPRLILQENYASIVMNAIVAIALLDCPSKDSLIDRVAKLGIEWFSELLARRLLDTAGKRADRADNLRQLNTRLLSYKTNSGLAANACMAT